MEPRANGVAGAMKILISGGTGFFGLPLTRHLQAAGHGCAWLTRDPSRARRLAPSNAVHIYSYQDDLPPSDVVINLAGESVVGLWTARKKASILDSRGRSTRHLIQAMSRMQEKPTVFISASAVGYYGDRPGELLEESAVPDPKNKFRAVVCLDWENAAMAAQENGIRTVLLRFGQVLHPSGGYLKPIASLFKWCIGIGVGRPGACLSWVSLEDAIRVIDWVIATERVQGPINVTAPTRTTTKDFTEALAKAYKRRTWGWVPPWTLRAVLGDFASALVDDQQVIPQKAVDAGFVFTHPDIDFYFQSIRLGE